jgi:RNA polymerase sigma-70 factor (ECF subfamily)
MIEPDLTRPNSQPSLLVNLGFEVDPRKQFVMPSAPDLDTSSTLIRRLSESPPDQAAWNKFVGRYAPLIFRWGRQWGASAHDVDDVTQSVLLELARQMRSFEYDSRRSFRGWLHIVSYRCWCRFVRQRVKTKASGNAHELDQLCSPEAGADFLELLDKESDKEILEIAIKRVRDRVQAHTWEAFRLTAAENLTAAEAATRLGLKVGTVFVARSKVQKMIREEIQALGYDDAR